MIQAVETIDLSKRYGRTWALRDCTLRIPIGHITGLVGPNGAGKSTLLHLAMGLLTPTKGSVKVLGYEPGKQQKELLPKVGFVAQEHPLYKQFMVKDMMTLGRKLNPGWDQELAITRLKQLEIPLDRPTGKLSGGQQAQVALIMCLAKRPELLILDEPVASLDPLARHEFQQTLLAAVADYGLSVILSSHIVADLERFCDHLVILSSSKVQITGDVEKLLQSHKRLIGPCARKEAIARTHTILQASTTDPQCTLLVQTNGPVLDPAWEVKDVSLEDLILAYLAQSRSPLKIQEQQKQEVVQ